MITENFIKAFATAANKEGITKIQCYVEKTEELMVNVFEGKPEQTELSKLERIYLEGEWKGKVGSVYTEKLEEYVFEELLEGIRQSAECGMKIWKDRPLGQVEITKEQDEKYFDIETITALLLAAEQAALEVADEVQAVSECWYKRRNKSVMITNGRESMCENCGVVEQFGMKAIASGKDQTQTCFRTFLIDTTKNIKELAKETAREAVELLGAITLTTRNYPVILQNHVVSELISEYLPAFYAENVNSGMSCLCNKLHSKVGCETVTISEEPLMVGTALRRSFDDEGEPTRAKNLITCGELTTYLCNRATSNDTMPAGNGFRMEYKQPVSTGVTNIVFHSGDNSEEELINKMDEGLVITHIDGAFAGAKFSSGDFALIAKGYQIKEKKKIGTFHRITIAGDFVSMLHSIQAIGNNPYTLHQVNQTVTAPSILVKKLTISGV